MVKRVLEFCFSDQQWHILLVILLMDTLGELFPNIPLLVTVLKIPLRCHNFLDLLWIYSKELSYYSLP